MMTVRQVKSEWTESYLGSGGAGFWRSLSSLLRGVSSHPEVFAKVGPVGRKPGIVRQGSRTRGSGCKKTNYGGGSIVFHLSTEKNTAGRLISTTNRVSQDVTR